MYSELVDGNAVWLQKRPWAGDGSRLPPDLVDFQLRKERMGRICVRHENGFESWTNLNDREIWNIEVDGRRCAWRMMVCCWWELLVA